MMRGSTSPIRQLLLHMIVSSYSMWWQFLHCYSLTCAIPSLIRPSSRHFKLCVIQFTVVRQKPANQTPLSSCKCIYYITRIQILYLLIREDLNKKHINCFLKLSFSNAVFFDSSHSLIFLLLKTYLEPFLFCGYGRKYIITTD